MRKTADEKPENTNGYIWVYVPKHPNAMSNGYIYEHRLVMERALGRFLRDNEQVQHTDRDPHNNVISNLELWIDDPIEGLIQEDLSKLVEKKPKAEDIPEVLRHNYKPRKSSVMAFNVVARYLARGSNI